MRLPACARRQHVIDQEGRISLLAFQQQVQCADHHGMVVAQQRQFLARQRRGAVESDLLRAVLEAAEAFRAEVFRIQHPGARAGFLVLHAELLEQAQDEVLLREWRAYTDYLTRIDKVIIYSDEPLECKERSKQLQAEMAAIRQKACLQTRN